MLQIFDGILSSFCQCELNSANLFGQTVSCTPDNGIITFQATFAYANANGTQTASSLAAEAEQWITGERNVSGVVYIIEVSPASTASTASTQTPDDSDDVSLLGFSL